MRGTQRRWLTSRMNWDACVEESETSALLIAYSMLLLRRLRAAFLAEKKLLCVVFTCCWAWSACYECNYESMAGGCDDDTLLLIASPPTFFCFKMRHSFLAPAWTLYRLSNLSRNLLDAGYEPMLRSLLPIYTDFFAFCLGLATGLDSVSLSLRPLVWQTSAWY